MGQIIIEEKKELLAAKIAERLKAEGLKVIAEGDILRVEDYIFLIKSSNEQPKRCGTMYELPASYGEEMLYSYIKMTVSTSLERKIEDMTVDTILSLGISRALKGYMYLADSIVMCVEKPDKLYCLSKDVYPEIAEKYGVEMPCVERSIRHAICKAYSENPTPMREMFRRPIQRPKSQELIAECADTIRRVFY